MTGAGTFAAMSSPAYRRLFYSASIVVFGVVGQSVARGWLARELTGTNAGLGGVMLVFGVSMLLATPVGGMAADRYPKRTVLFWSVVALMLSSVGVGVAVVADVIQYWMLVVAGGVQAAAFAFYLPARLGSISELIEYRLIGNAVVLSQVAQESMRVVAPTLAGVLIGVTWFGVGGVFLLGGVTAAVAAAVVLTLPPMPTRSTVSRSPFAEIVDGIRYVRVTPGLGALALLTVGVVMVAFPYMVFLPTLAEERYGVGVTGFGVMSGVAGLGAVLAGLLNARMSRGARPWLTIAWAGVSLGVATFTLAFADAYVVALGAIMALGGAGLVFQTSSQSLMLRLSAMEYHGRLQSMVILGFSGFGLAALPLGLLADATSLEAVLAANGAIILAMMTVFGLYRRAARRVVGPTQLG
jgi:MFS family permease